MERPIANSYWVVDGRFLAGEYPTGKFGSDAKGAERVRQLVAAGINLFIDLTEPDECTPYDELLPGNVDYLRSPIPDAQLPKQVAQMRALQRDIAHALGAGRRVYVHCRAGIGRTGTTVGCFLVEQGLDGDAALTELNRLWLQSARSDSWPQLPQTDKQAAYIRGWTPTGEARAHTAAVAEAALADDSPGVPLFVPAGAPTSATAAPLPLQSMIPASPGTGPTQRERFQGALLGLALGEALAAGSQQRAPGAFAPVTDLVGGGVLELPRGAWSDDTAMALCLADSLVQKQAFDPRDQVERYQRWQREGYLSATGQCKGITASTARALAAAGWRRQLYAGSHDPAQLDAEPLARLAPVVMFHFADGPRAVEHAGEAARATCQAPLVVDACRLFGAMLYQALHGESRAQVLTPPRSLFGHHAPRVQVQDLMQGAAQPPAPDRTSRSVHSVLTALAGIRWAFALAPNFREGALRAANLGGSADVIAAGYGQLAGAWFGVGALPQPWLALLARREQIATLADQLLQVERVP